MQAKKKQITALGLLLLAALPLILSVGIFIKQKIVHYQRRERFETEQVQTITVSAEKIYWINHGKEILVNGKLFDVKSFKTAGADIILTGFYDDKEDKLVNHVSNLMHHDEEGSGTSANHFIVKFLCFPAYKDITGFSLQNSWQIIDRRFRDYSEALSSIDCTAVLPPPKYC